MLSKDEEIQSLVEYLSDKIKLKSKKQIDHINVVISNLYYNYCFFDKFTAYSRDRRNLPKRYNQFSIGYTNLLRVVDRLEEQEYIEHKTGFRVPNSITSRISRMRATDKLKLLFIEYLLKPYMVQRVNDDEVIILKNKKKKWINYVDNRTTTKMRNKIEKYNNLLASTDICLSAQLEDSITSKVDISRKSVGRIFNDGSWSRGGRFYGAWWMTVKKVFKRAHPNKW